MTHHTSHPRLHMGCGESLRSHWLAGFVQIEHKLPPASRKPKAAKAKRGRTRG